MSYPKPLSEKTIERLYQEAGIDAEIREYLHKLFIACANFYGAIPLRIVWAMYPSITGAPKIRRKDLIAFSGIVRREKQPYYVFEIEELYTEEPHNELERHIVSGELISSGYGKFYWFYELMENRESRPYCLPDDLLSYANPVSIPEETAFLQYLGSLKSTADICKPEYGNSWENENKGKKLNSFSFFNSHERFDLEYSQRNKSRLAEIQRECAGSEAEKILRLFKRMENTDPLGITKHIKYVMEELLEAGVVLTMNQVNKLMELISALHNNSCLWGLSGWKPTQLAQLNPNQGMPEILFGPGMQKAFDEGTMNKEELLDAIRKRGFTVID